MWANVAIAEAFVIVGLLVLIYAMKTAELKTTKADRDYFRKKWADEDEDEDA